MRSNIYGGSMMNQKISQENWNNLKGDIQKSFANLSADELEQTHGDANLLTDLVSRKAGLPPEDAEKKLDDIISRRATSTGAFIEEDEYDEFRDYVLDADDERFGTDEGLTSPSSHASAAPRQDFATDKSGDKSPDRPSEPGRIVSPDGSGRNERSSSEYPTERRGPERTPHSSSEPKKPDRNI